MTPLILSVIQAKPMELFAYLNSLYMNDEGKA